MPPAQPGPAPPTWLLTSLSPSSYNEFYFLTHPALFIEDHFPDNKNWQLLKPPQSLRQFENNMYHKSEFYNKGMLSAHPETSIIKTGNRSLGAALPGPSLCQLYMELRGGRGAASAQQLRLPRPSGHQDRTRPRVTFRRTNAPHASINQDGDVMRSVAQCVREPGLVGGRSQLKHRERAASPPNRSSQLLAQSVFGPAEPGSACQWTNQPVGEQRGSPRTEHWGAFLRT